MTTVGVIGLGDIGNGVADGWSRPGIDLVVCDLRPEATAAFAGRGPGGRRHPAELGGQADVVVVAVVDDDQVLRRARRAPAGALAAMAAGSTVVVAGHGGPAHGGGRGRRGRRPGASTSSTAG